ncbi:isopentenyl-diphosphate Delta-isomerase [Nocardioides sp. TRM66260-LWL]|uniref:isopentenyl-diphosphate Delta-isomerase n=1 Tax=Nocardioides sp. TRM66260-LWL TaxID=2874478 RepID=UPI001CC421B2|nr:isopentenyl-diphosphate Delta-isomerase [Nocardioides sp. TRM66260-LWL]MBZ5734572.1 isopentenyl-diphosphate Delta-isomerase [Nocardioides sp. TRM66260-LWL]
MVTRPSHLPPTATLADLDDLVVLLDDDARPAGTAARRHVHTEDTPLHLAFSLYLLDEDDRLLLTRRALGKTAWPGVWTNTCCGHPRPDESMTDAVTRRVEEELGLHVPAPQVVLPDFRYRAVDASGVVEHEVCPVHLARVPSGTVPRPDPAEVAEHTWVPWAQVRVLAAAAPALLSPWMVLQVAALGEQHGDDLGRALRESVDAAR